MRPWNGKTIVILAFFGCVLMFTSWRQSHSDNSSGQLHLVYDRLLRAEQRGEVLSQELLKVLGHLQNRTNSLSNLTSSNSSAWQERALLRFLSTQPNALLYLPHLKEHKDSLKPIVHLGQGRSGVSMVFGVPTVYRQKQSYLVNTLQSLLYDLSPAEKKDIVIVVFVAETNATFVKEVAQSVQNNLPDAVSSGLIEVISPSPHFYPNFTDLKETFGDSKERVRWRTKQNLDYSFLMLYTQNKGTYYVQLEDDIVAKAGYLGSMKMYTNQVFTEDWLYLEFSQLGFIGKLFQSSDLPMIVEFILMFHKDKPIDWLLDHILWVKVCNPEKDFKHCSAEKAKLKRTYKPSLFQHVGLHSSLPGKIQNLKDKDFGKQVLFKAHPNPPAVLTSSLEHYQTHTLEKAYNGQDFFWGLTPKRRDHILITFTSPQAVKGFLFRSGNIETNGDKFYNTTVEGLPTDSSVNRRVERGELPCCKPSSDGFIVIGKRSNQIPTDRPFLVTEPLLRHHGGAHRLTHMFRHKHDHLDSSVDRCNTSFDAVAKIRGEIFFFKGQHMWRVSRGGLVSIRAVPVQRLWSALPSTLPPLQAVLERHTDHDIIFISGSQVWLFKDLVLQEGFPQPLSALVPEDSESGWQGLHWDPTEGVVWGSMRVKTEKGETSEESEEWRELIAGGVNGIIMENEHEGERGGNLKGSTYVFKGNSYWKFTHPGSAPEEGYPRLLATDWLDCPQPSSYSPSDISLISQFGQQELRDQKGQRTVDQIRHKDKTTERAKTQHWDCPCLNSAVTYTGPFLLLPVLFLHVLTC